MNKRRVQVIVTVLVCVSPLVMLELMRRLPPASPFRQYDVIITVILAIIGGSMLLYTYATRRDNSATWWQDDDWTHWGGI